MHSALRCHRCRGHLLAALLLLTGCSWGLGESRAKSVHYQAQHIKRVKELVETCVVERAKGPALELVRTLDVMDAWNAADCKDFRLPKGAKLKRATAQEKEDYCERMGLVGAKNARLKKFDFLIQTHGAVRDLWWFLIWAIRVIPYLVIVMVVLYARKHIMGLEDIWIRFFRGKPKEEAKVTEGTPVQDRYRRQSK